MYRDQEYATSRGGARTGGRSGGERSGGGRSGGGAPRRLRLVEPHRRAEDDVDSPASTDRWPGLTGIPGIAGATGRLPDRRGRHRPVTAAAIEELDERLFRHLTRHLGSVSGAWSKDPAGFDLGFEVVEFAPGRIDGAVAYSTLGLSHYILDSPIADGHFRLELIMVAPERLRGSSLPFVLGDYGRMIMAMRELPELGTTVRNIPGLAQVSTMDTLYLGRPPHLTPDFTRLRGGELAVNIDWLLPVSEAEATFVDAEGWAAFEKLIYGRDDFDPTDYDRPSVPV